jgi:hypothetical protein
MATTSTPQYVEQVQSNIPAWMQPYAAQLLGSVFGGQDPTTGQFMPGLVGQGYQPYMVPKRDEKGDIIKDDKGNPVLIPGQRVAEFSPLQQEAFNRLAGMGVSPELTQAADIARRVGGAANYPAYTPATERNFYTDAPFREMGTSFERVGAAPFTQFQMQGPRDVASERVRAAQMGPVRDVIAGQFTAPQMAGYERVGLPAAYGVERAQGYGYGPLEMTPSERVRAANLRQYRMGPAERVGTERFGLGAMQEYMTPYMQSVVERQKRAAVQDYMRGLPAIGAAAARAGGRGGTREALLQSEAQRNLATQLGDIEAKGSQQAYEQSAAQFERDRAAAMQAALANQAATQDVARQNLQAAMGIQQLGAGQSLEAQRLNQAMGLTVGQQNLAAEQARQQFMGQQSLQAQLANQQAAQREAEFYRQQQMQGALANQQAGLTVGQQNLAAQLQTQGLNAQQAIEAARLNQAADLTIGQQNLSAEQQARLANQQTGLQAALANQQMGYNVDQQNLQALINQSQFGAGQGLQAQQMNQAAQLQAQQQALAQLAQANQFSQQNAAQRAQYGLAGANLAEQSRQFGAGLGLQGLQQQLAAAGALGGLGMQQYQQGMGINQALLGAGGQQQALNQQLLNMQYQDFVNQQQFPYKQAEFAMGILRGLPATGQTSTMYQQPGSLFGQIAGIAGGVGSLFGGLGQQG